MLPGGVKFDTNSIGDLTGKVIFVTGGNVGLGRETVRILAQHNPQKIYLAARSEEKAQRTISELTAENPNISKIVSFISLDLASLPSIQSCARSFLSAEKRLDILFCNAGVMALPAGITKEGYEIQFGTNHLGHALLLKLLLPTLQRTAELPGADVRVVMLSSIGHNAAQGRLPLGEMKGGMGGVSTWTRYGYSKYANLLWAQQLSMRYPRVLSVAVHPGMVDSNLYTTFIGTGVLNKIFNTVKGVGKTLLPMVWLNVAEGAKNQLWAATAPRGEGKGKVEAGKYYDPVGREGTRFINNPELDEKNGKELWEWTEKELAGYNL